MGFSFSIQSNTTKQIINDYLNIVNSVTASAVADAHLNTITTQNAVQSICPAKDCFAGGQPVPSNWYQTCGAGSATINQTSSTSQSLSVANLNNIKQTVSNNITAKTEQYVKEVAAGDPGWFKAAIGIQFNESTFSSAISESVINSISTDASSICSGLVITDQGAKQIICSTVNTATINQDAAINNAVQCVVKQVVTQVATNTLIAAAVQRGENWAAANEGGNWIYYIIVGIIILVVFFILLAVFKAYTREPKPPKQPPPPVIHTVPQNHPPTVTVSTNRNINTKPPRV